MNSSIILYLFVKIKLLNRTNFLKKIRNSNSAWRDQQRQMQCYKTNTYLESLMFHKLTKCEDRSIVNIGIIIIVEYNNLLNWIFVKRQ